MSNKWTIEYFPEAIEDINHLDGSVKSQVVKAIDKISGNPLPQNEGGYGKPLGNKTGLNLTGLLKVKLKQTGIRIVYYLVKNEEKMKVVIVGMRADNNVYKQAAARINKQ